jgi:hypothetical protein
MDLLNFIQSIPYNGMSHLVINGCEFRWINGWKYVGKF